MALGTPSTDHSLFKKRIMIKKAINHCNKSNLDGNFIKRQLNFRFKTNSKFMQIKDFLEKETSRDILQKPVSRLWIIFLFSYSYENKNSFSHSVYELQIAARIPNIFVRT